MDEAWLGKGFARLPATLKGIANGLVQHHLNTGSGAAGAAAADEEEDDTSGEVLFEDEALDRLREVLRSVKASPYAAAFAGILGALTKKQREAVMQYDTA